MGYLFADQYSSLHAAVGLISYFWNIPLLVGTIIHFLFELAENTKWGVSVINKYIIEPGYFSWPGEKHRPDSWLNMLGDNIFYILGWILAYYLDVVGKKQGWYTKEKLISYWETN